MKETDSTVFWKIARFIGNDRTIAVMAGSGAAVDLGWTAYALTKSEPTAAITNAIAAPVLLYIAIAKYKAARRQQ